jgi:hypothetical protein
VDYNRAAVVVSIQNWLGESEDSRKNASMPGYLNIGMSIMALGTSYLPLFLPPQAGGVAPRAAAPAS